MAAQGSGTRIRVTLTVLNRNTADFRVILIDIGQGFYFSGSAWSNFCFNTGKKKKWKFLSKIYSLSVHGQRRLT